MKFTQPVPALVIRYSFLWSQEAKRGAEEGSKDRPCAVLLSTTTKAGKPVVMVLPVTHTPPADPRYAVELPAATKARLGLDDARSWIVITEVNRFQWPGPDLCPIPGDPDGRNAYGLLPTSLFDEVRTKWLAAYAASKISQIERSD